MAFARVNGVVIHHELGGRSNGPAVVFSNSLGTDFRIWDEVADGLADRCRILLYDKRGHGLSEATPPPYHMTDHVEDLAALMRHAGIERATIVGLSVGGMIAQGLAAMHPEMVSSLILCDTAHKIGTTEMWNDRIATVQEKGIAPLVDGVMQRWFTQAYRAPDNADFVGYSAMLARTSSDGYAGTCAAIRDADLTETTRALRMPTLCIVGDQDASTPPDLVRSMADLIQGSRFEIVAGAGHIPCVEQPAATTALIRAFIDQNS